MKHRIVVVVDDGDRELTAPELRAFVTDAFEEAGLALTIHEGGEAPRVDIESIRRVP